MDVARLNLSHGTHDDHEHAYTDVRRAAEQTGRSVGVPADLQWPKIRLGEFAAGPVTWLPGETVTITNPRRRGRRAAPLPERPLMWLACWAPGRWWRSPPAGRARTG
jgi:pyruvate kinase